MLSVLHVLSSLNLGGAERITVELAEVQRKHDLDAQILSLGGPDEFLVEEVRERGIPLQVNNTRQRRLRRYMHLYKVFRGFDVIHLHSRGAFKFVAPILPFLRQTRVVYTRHGLFPDDTPGLKFLYLLLRRFIHCIAFVTESGREVFTANHNWNPKKLVVVQNGVFVPKELPKASEGILRFGSIGRMVPVKGQFMLLDATEKLATACEEDRQGNQSFQLVFYGDGPLEAALKERAGRIGKDLVVFKGREPDIEKIYGDLDVLVVASESEGLSMVIMEAMARGIPTIATDVGGNGTLVLDGQTGILLAEQSSQALCEAMLTMLRDRAVVKTLGARARTLVESRFSLLNTHQSYLQCYQSEYRGDASDE